MGAANFETVGLGRDLRSAFRSAVDQAAYEYGHGGYTGTIAEKNDVVLAGTLERVTVRRLVDAIGDVVYEEDVEERWDPRAAAYVTVRTDAQAKAIRRLPESLRRLRWDVIVGAYADKWGAAAAVRVTGAEATRIKKAYGRAGTRDDVFLFVGMASS